MFARCGIAAVPRDPFLRVPSDRLIQNGRYKENDDDVAEHAGAGIGAAVGGLLTGEGTMAIPGVGPVVAAGGWLRRPQAHLPWQSWAVGRAA